MTESSGAAFQGPLTVVALDADFPTIARCGMRAVMALWQADTKTFRRSSADDTSQMRPTVTFRCTEILLGALVESPDLFEPSDVEALEIVSAGIASADPETVLATSDLGYAPFTLALMLLATARIATSGFTCADAATARLKPLTERLSTELRPKALPAVHPFVQEHAIRAVLKARPHLSGGARTRASTLLSRLEESSYAHAERLVAKHHMGLITPGESVALAFCAAALAVRGAKTDDRMSLAALEAAASTQDAAGSWPLGRVVRAEPSRLEISTYEVAWVVTAALSRLLARPGTAIDPTSIAETVSRAGRFAERSVVEAGTIRGWSSDHPYQDPRVESWTSAIALQFATAAEDLARQLQNDAILKSFRSVSPRDERWPAFLRWDSLASKAEPDSVAPVYDYLLRNVIEPIRRHPKHLPSGSTECASVLLFGPPGTSKTTIVQAVADALQWPVVFLSPGAFIAGGLEAIEPTAQSVFDRLHALRRVVVIFDECDELFRDRTPSGPTEQLRNISAFVTASMLPKLQDLHDRGEILFFVCTNQVRMMDEAVTRGGRIDHRIGVGPPDQPARQRIVDELSLPSVPRLGDALTELVDTTNRFSRSELRRAAQKLATTGPWRTASAARSAARAVVQSMNGALAITPESLAEFEEDRAKFSAPYLEKEV